MLLGVRELVQVNGISTLGENIADNGGLRISYDALQTWLSDHRYDDALLPGLNMTHSQQFFLSFAQVISTQHTRCYRSRDVACAASRPIYRSFGLSLGLE